MPCTRLSSVALVVALALPSTARAAEPTPSTDPAPVFGPQPPPESQPQAPVDEAPVESVVIEPATADATAPDPTPAAVPPPDVPPSMDPDRRAQLDLELVRAEFARDTGGSILIGAGVVTIVGLVLVFTGTGVAARAVGDCSGSDCDGASTRQLIHAGRTLIAGYAISGIGALGIIGGIAAYGHGRYRVDRARASLDRVSLAPTARGVSLGVGGRF